MLRQNYRVHIVTLIIASIVYHTCNIFTGLLETGLQFVETVSHIGEGDASRGTCLEIEIGW